MGGVPITFYLPARVRLSCDANFFNRHSSSWAKIRLHTENQLSMLSGSALKVCVGWLGGGVGSTELCGHTKLVLG